MSKQTLTEHQDLLHCPLHPDMSVYNKSKHLARDFYSATTFPPPEGPEMS